MHLLRPLYYRDIIMAENKDNMTSYQKPISVHVKSNHEVLHVVE